MPKHFRRKKSGSTGSHKLRINKTKNYSYHNPEAVIQKTGDEDVKGSGNFYCTSCCRYFISREIQEEHEASKLHKKMLKRKEFDEEMDEKESIALRNYQRKRMKISEDVVMT